MTAVERLSIIVVNYGSSELLERNLVDTTVGVPDAQVFVVDNRTTEQEAERVRSLAAQHGWIALIQPSNRGFGAGVNVGVEAARAQGFTRHLLMNPDASMQAPATALLRAAVDSERPVIAAPRVVDGHGRTWSEGSVLDLGDGATHSAAWAARNPEALVRSWLTAAVLMVNDAAWTATGGFDEEYFLYWEDVDFSLRVQDAGGEMHLVAEAVAVHDEGGTQGVGDPALKAKSATYYYYNVRNRTMLAAKLFDRAIVQRWNGSSVTAARDIYLRGGRRQLLRPWRGLPALCRGWRDARRIARGALTALPR